jgi:ParB family chromosome partitioning protein
MAQKKQALGRGLSALMPTKPVFDLEIEADDNIKEQVVWIPIEDLHPNPHQPRKDFDQEKLEELATSIKQYGIIQPLIVMTKNEGYEIIAGERRYRAAQIAGIEKLPCLRRNLAPREVTEISLIENIQRADLHAIEEAEAYSKLLTEFGYTQEQLAQKLGKSRPYIANALRLLSLPEVVQNMIREGKLTAGHGRALLMLKNAVRQEMLAKRIVTNNLSVRQAETLAGQLNGGEIEAIKITSRKKPEPPATFYVAQRLQDRWGTKVFLKPKGKGGNIIIEYYTEEDLNRLIEEFLPGEEF